jgi:hypothetical protein
MAQANKPDEVVEVDLGPYRFRRERCGERVAWTRSRLKAEGAGRGGVDTFALDADAAALAEEVLRLRAELAAAHAAAAGNR